MEKKVVTVASGKGGTGKTTVSVNLAVALAKELSLKVLLVDTDFMLPSVNILLGESPKKDLMSFIRDDYNPDNIKKFISKSKYGVDVITGVSQASTKTDLPQSKLNKFAKDVSNLNYDFIIFDSGAGIHKEIFSFTKVSTSVLIVTLPEPAALIDAYKTIRTLHVAKEDSYFHMVFNRLMGKENTVKTIHNFVNLLKKKVSDNVSLCDIIPFDVNIVNSGIKQAPAVSLEVSPGSAVITRMAHTLSK